jgi:Flp pilus assembly protein TadD
MLAHFGQTDNSHQVYHTARACVLAPDAIADPMRAVELAEQAQSSLPGAPWAMYTLGMAHLRAGGLDEAAQSLQESLEVDPTWDARFLNWLGLALVHHERGETEEARQWLGKAVDLMEQHPASALHGRIEGQLLRREVEGLLGKPKQEQDDAESKKEE